MSTEDRAAKVARLQERATTYAIERPFLARLWRAAARYVEARVSRLAAFVTYYGFLALFPLAALGFAILGIMSRYIPALDDAVVDSITDNAGALGLTPQIVDQLQRAAVGLGLISLGFLVYAGVRWVEALREAIAVVCVGQPPKGRFAQRILADLLLLVLLGGLLLATIVLSTITTTSAGWVEAQLNLHISEGLLRLAAVAVSLLASSVLLGVVIWRLAGRPLRRRVLVAGAVLGGIGLEVLRLGATYIIGASLKNPVYGVFAITIGMLIWINFTAKWTLMITAWVAVADDEGLGTGLLSASPTRSGDEALPAALVASTTAQREQADDRTDDDQRPSGPAGDRPSG